MDKTYTIKKIDNSSLEATITIPKDLFKKSYENMLEAESKKNNIKGFRKGKTPKELIENKLKPEIMFEAFNRLAPMYVQKAVSEEKLEIVATPIFKEMPKLELEKDIEFTIVLTVMPEFKLGDLKKIKLEKKDEKVTEKEIEEIVTKLESNEKLKEKKKTAKWAIEAAKFLQIPEVKDIETLKIKIKEILQLEKNRIVEQQTNEYAMNKAIELCKITVPDAAIHEEAHEREHSFMHNLEGMKMTIEQYVKAANETIEHMREMWHRDAQKALETDVFLKLFAKERKITITNEQLNEEIEKIKKSNPKGDASVYENPQWVEYIRRVVVKQKAFEQFMSELSPKKK
ncbi:hypothetical protein M0R04_03865 [Candidatus Dojkabacteria bacterium]|jgi:FKBP-type peptidyl-prolyl cis-trans isomerase (trigger factor)|nr:hypothetical protein [Candidatus Dojkabacteria bacterium]